MLYMGSVTETSRITKANMTTATAWIPNRLAAGTSTESLIWHHSQGHQSVAWWQVDYIWSFSIMEAIVHCSYLTRHKREAHRGGDSVRTDPEIGVVQPKLGNISAIRSWKNHGVLLPWNFCRDYGSATP